MARIHGVISLAILYCHLWIFHLSHCQHAVRRSADDAQADNAVDQALGAYAVDASGSKGDGNSTSIENESNSNDAASDGVESLVESADNDAFIDGAFLPPPNEILPPNDPKAFDSRPDDDDDKGGDKSLLKETTTTHDDDIHRLSSSDVEKTPLIRPDQPDSGSSLEPSVQNDDDDVVVDDDDKDDPFNTLFPLTELIVIGVCLIFGLVVNSLFVMVMRSDNNYRFHNSTNNNNDNNNAKAQRRDFKASPTYSASSSPFVSAAAVVVPKPTQKYQPLALPSTRVSLISFRYL